MEISDDLRAFPKQAAYRRNNFLSIVYIFYRIVFPFGGLHRNRMLRHKSLVIGFSQYVPKAFFFECFHRRKDDGQKRGLFE